MEIPIKSKADVEVLFLSFLGLADVVKEGAHVDFLYKKSQGIFDDNQGLNLSPVLVPYGHNTSKTFNRAKCTVEVGEKVVGCNADTLHDKFMAIQDQIGHCIKHDDTGLLY